MCGAWFAQEFVTLPVEFGSGVLRFKSGGEDDGKIRRKMCVDVMLRAVKC